MIEELNSNLDDIDNFIAKFPDPDSFGSDDEFMSHQVQLMNYVLYLLKVSCALSPDNQSAEHGFPKHEAVIAGHTVRIFKLYEGSLIHISGRKLELASIFFRLIFETFIRMLYLMKKGHESINDFMLKSYRAEREILEDLSAKKERRELTPIENRIEETIRNKMDRDGITLQQLMDVNTWALDGKSFRQILEEVADPIAYPYAFGASSHSIHGNWQEILVHHLRREDSRYSPMLQYDDPDPRLACSITTVSIEAAIAYLDWVDADKEDTVVSRLRNLNDLNRKIDHAHEAYFSSI